MHGAGSNFTEEDVLHGRRFPDAIANGSYRVDVHHPEGGGYLFKYLNGTTLDIRSTGNTRGRWRAETPTNPTFYQIPYRCMVSEQWENLILAGRMISTGHGAFGAVRVMVNLNQTGEAAGVAAAIARDCRCPVSTVNVAELRSQLAAGGAVILKCPLCPDRSGCTTAAAAKAVEYRARRSSRN